LNVEERKKRLVEYAKKFKIPEKAILAMMEDKDRYYNQICDEIQGKKMNDTLNVIAEELAGIKLLLSFQDEAIKILIQKTDHL